MVFPSVREALNFFEQYCASKTNGWKECTTAKMLEKHYERRYGDEKNKAD